MSGVVGIMNGELQIPFTSFLSYDERLFLKLMRNGVDNQIQYTRSWLNTSEASELLNVDEDDFDDEFHESQFYTGMSELMDANTRECLGMLSKFYQTGAKIGSNELKQATRYTEYDKKAFNILQKYVGNVIYDVNVELANGIKDNLEDAVIDSKSILQIMQGLVILPFVPLKSNISVDTRCKVITRTEYARTVNTATLQVYSNSGIRMVEITTRGDELVCDDCIFFEENNPYTIEQACAILPVHPNCRCGFSPYYENIGTDAEPVVIDLTQNLTTDELGMVMSL